MPGFSSTAIPMPSDWVSSPGNPFGSPKRALSAKKSSDNKIYNIPLLEAFPHLIAKTEGEVGIEIECEGTNLFSAPIQYWTAKTDHSLRNVGDHPPIEYVLQKPIPRDKVPNALSYLSKKLKEAGSVLSDSTRTSVHVHVNCQELTVKQIYQYWCMYSIFEELLIRFSGPNRVGNLFCLSGKQAEYNVSVMESAIQTENFNELFNNDLRYTACNVASLGKFGSLEFRSMRGTIDQELIQTWVDILLILRDKALEYDSPIEIVDDFIKLNPSEYLQKIFKERPDIIQMLRKNSDVYPVMWEGLRMMRDVAHSIKWEQRVAKKKESIKSEPLNLEESNRIYGPTGDWYTTSAVGQFGLPADSYWVVNMTPSIIVANLRNDMGTWQLQPYRKAAFLSSGTYMGTVDTTFEDRAPE